MDQAKGESPKIHEERASKFAEAKGWQVVEVYDLAGVSGKSTLGHPETKRMLEDVASGRIEGLIFSQLSRLARNTQELLEYANHFEKYDASLISLNESIQTNTASGKFFFTIISALATWERENNLERIMASLETRRALGKFTGGMASYGYKIENAEVVINEEEAPVRRLIYDLFLEHKRRKVVARLLNEMGYKTRKNKAWTDTTVNRLLQNTDAKGVRRLNYHEKETKDNPSGIKPEEEWIYVPCPALISEEKWEAVNKIINDQISKNKNSRPLNQRTNIFTGFVECHNGHTVYIPSKIKKYSCSKCKVRIHKDDLEYVFKKRIQTFLDSEEDRQRFMSSSVKELDNRKKELKLLESKIEEVSKKLDRLLVLNIEGQIPTEGFKDHYDPLFEQKEQLRKTYADTREEIKNLELMQSSTNRVFDKSKDFYENWDALDLAEKRQVVEMTTNKIVFDGSTINFHMKQVIPPASLELGADGQQRGTM